MTLDLFHVLGYHKTLHCNYFEFIYFHLINHIFLFQWDDFDNIGGGCFTGFNVDECPATIIGVALDGFPVYSPQNCSCAWDNIQSDGSCSEWPSTPWDTFTSSDLDDCHGREVDDTQSSDENAEHIYEYRLTHDAPYHVACLKGETATTAKCSQDSSSKKRGDELLDLEEMIAMKALEEGAAEHILELNEILEKAAQEVEEEEEKRKEEVKRREEEERKRKEEERKRKEQEEQARRVNKLRSLLAQLLN